jgi:hypothetical protein
MTKEEAIAYWDGKLARAEISQAYHDAALQPYTGEPAHVSANFNVMDQHSAENQGSGQGGYNSNVTVNPQTSGTTTNHYSDEYNKTANSLNQKFGGITRGQNYTPEQYTAARSYFAPRENPFVQGSMQGTLTQSSSNATMIPQPSGSNHIYNLLGLITYLNRR